MIMKTIGRKKVKGTGRPKSGIKLIPKYRVSYKLPHDLYWWLRMQKEPSTYLVINALRKTYNLPDPDPERNLAIKP
jgi:hypothetical protein